MVALLWINLLHLLRLHIKKLYTGTLFLSQFLVLDLTSDNVLHLAVLKSILTVHGTL